MRICTNCKQDLELVDFYKKGRGYQSWCKVCANERAKQHYRDNQKNKIAYTKKRKRRQVEENRQFIVNYLSTHSCVDCSETDIVVLEFDHRDDKSHAVSSMFRMSKDRLIEEISKCDVRCANCHRRKTAKEFKHYRTYLLPSLA